MQEIYNGSIKKTLQLNQNPAWFCSHEKQVRKRNSCEFCIFLSTQKKGQSLNSPAECHEKSQDLHHPPTPPLVTDIFGIWRISMDLDNITTLKRDGFVSNLLKSALSSPGRTSGAAWVQ